MQDLDGVAAALEPPLLEAAIDALLAQREAAPGYVHQPVGTYRALCLEPASEKSQDPVLLLAGNDGEVYLPQGPASAMIAAVLQRRRFRATDTTVTLRLPRPLGGTAQMFTLWASPRYLAAGAGAQPVWK
jgi:hypothetical protein